MRKISMKTLKEHSDYSAVVRSEAEREFSFMPDDRCDTPEKFTEELLKYARQNNLNLVITKESLSPRMLIDGIEYRAYRTSSRFGIVIHCEMLHPEDYIPDGMSKKKYRRYRLLSIIALPALIFIICSLGSFAGLCWSMDGRDLQYRWELQSFCSLQLLAFPITVTARISEDEIYGFNQNV